MDIALKTFIEQMPKIELHLHIEGSLEPDLLFKLAERNNVAIPYDTIDELKRAYNFGNLQEFLDLYYQGMSVLQTEQDYYDLTMAYIQKIASQNVTHTEIFFDPQGHTERGVSFDTVIRGICRGLDDAKETYGVTSKLIMSFLRHLSQEDAFAILEEAKPYMHHIDGFGLDSSEKDNPPSKFARLYEILAKEYPDKKRVAHAGEEGPASYVKEALDLLNVDRIDHGNRSLEDPELVKRLADSDIGLTVCPLSNVKLCGVHDMKEHPLKTMLDYGLKTSVNSDDPAYFGGYMNENYIAVADALNLRQDDIIHIAQHAIDTSFLSIEEKKRKTQQLSEYVENTQLVSNKAAAE